MTDFNEKSGLKFKFQNPAEDYQLIIVRLTFNSVRVFLVSGLTLAFPLSDRGQNKILFFSYDFILD